MFVYNIILYNDIVVGIIASILICVKGKKDRWTDPTLGGSSASSSPLWESTINTDLLFTIR